MTAPYTPLPPPAAPPGGTPPWQALVSPPPAPAQARSQVAVFVVCASALGIATAPFGALGWGVALCLGLAGGIVVGLAVDVSRGFRTVPGLLMAMVAIVGTLFALFVMAAVGGPILPPGVVLLVGAFVLGLDWQRVDRLRPVALAASLPVLVALLSEEPWVFAAGVAWLALAFGSLSLLEADRRAGQPRAQPLTGAGPPQVRADDLLTTVVAALALALVAALVLSVPSCQRRFSGGSGSGSGSAGQVGSTGGSGGGSGGGYVPDPNGRYLLPRDPGSEGPGGGPLQPIPAPESLPSLPPGERQQRTDPDGTVVTSEGTPDGGLEVTVESPDGTTERYRYHPPDDDGLTRIDRLGRDGDPTETYYYDPDGRLAEDPSTRTDPEPEAAPKPSEGRHGPNWRTVALVVAGLVLAGLVAWWLWRRFRRPPVVTDPSAPPWALALVARLEAEGRARGRPRRSAEPVVAYVQVLAAGPLPDDRLPDVGAIVSHALFSRAEPGPDAQRWAETALDAAIEDHPVPERSGRTLLRSR